MSYIMKNRSEYAGKSGETDWWNWTAFIESTGEDELEDVKYVEYRLHPSFKDPVVWVKDSADGFAFTKKGWGTFELAAKVIFRDSTRKPVLLKHYLEFQSAD